MDLSTIGRQLLGAAVAVSLVTLSASVAFAQGACQAPSDVFLNPFDKDSAHNRPIGTGAQYAGDSHPTTRAWLQANGFGINVGGPWGVDAVAVTGSDPVMRVQATPGGYGLPQNVRLPRGGLITRIAHSGGSTDGVAVIHDRTSNQTHQLRNYDWNNGNPRALQYRTWSIRGLGHGTRPGERPGTSASGVAALFGLLRGYEINTPGRRIEHALQIALPARPLNPGCNVMLSREIKLPATGRDNFASQPQNNNGVIAYGSLFTLPRNVNIRALGLSEAGVRLAEAIQNYGIYVVDNGGCASGAIRADQDVDPQLRNRLVNSDIPKIHRHMRMVLNSDWQPGQAAVGGGQPIAPNCAYNAGATNVAAPSTGQSSGSQTSSLSSGGSAAAPAPSSGGSAPETGSSQPPSTQPAQSSGGQQTSAGTLTWPPTNGARGYYLEIRNARTGTRVHGRFVTQGEASCRGAVGTCSYTPPTLPSGASYEWRVRANDGTPQPFSAYAPLSAGSVPATGSSQSPSTQPVSGGSAPATGSSQPPSTQPDQSSGGQQTSAGTLAWDPTDGAHGYYLEIRNAGTGARVHGRFVTQGEAGCRGAVSTCSYTAPTLSSDASYEWRVRANDGTPQAFSAYTPLG